jgi:hypothetical protein
VQAGVFLSVFFLFFSFFLPPRSLLALRDEVVQGLMADGGFVMVDWNWIGVLIVEATTTCCRRGVVVCPLRGGPHARVGADTIRCGSARLRSVCGH